MPATTTAAANAFLLLVFVLGQRHCIAGDVGNSPSSFNVTSRLYLERVSCTSRPAFFMAVQSFANDHPATRALAL